MKRYRVADGLTIVLPSAIGRTPDGANARFTSGATFDVDVENPEIAPYLRFLRKRVQAGDLVEVDLKDEHAPASTGRLPSTKGSER